MPTYCTHCSTRGFSRPFLGCLFLAEQLAWEHLSTMSLAVATRLLTIPSGPSDRVKTISLIIGAFTLIYRWGLRRKEDWTGLEPPHTLIDSLYFSATVFSAPCTTLRQSSSSYSAWPIMAAAVHAFAHSFAQSCACACTL